MNVQIRPRQRPAGLPRHGSAGARRRLRPGDLRAQPRLIVARRKTASERARAVLGAPRRMAYGPAKIEGLDVFDCGTKNAPINVFVHGGAWRRNMAADYALIAEPLVRAGSHSVVIDFINVDQAKGDLFPMYHQVRRALAWVYNNAATFGGDRDRIHVSAHSPARISSGVVLTRGWREEGLPPDAFKGAVLLSGMYELHPVRLSKRSSYVNFTDDMVEKLFGHAASRRVQHAAHPRHRFLRDAGVPAPVARLRRGGYRPRRQAGRADRRARPTIISNCSRRLPTRMVCSGGRCSSRWKLVAK